MAEKQETIADIIAEKRREANYIVQVSQGKCQTRRDKAEDEARDIRREADRIEAAHRRELSKNTSKNGADFGQLGDAAKLREAVKAVVDVGYPHDFQREAPHIRGYCYDITRAIEKCFAALAAPLRNCDRFATVKEATEAFARERQDMPHPCPDFTFSRWLLTPVKKEGGDK